MISIWELWKRSETGDTVTENDFDMKIMRKAEELKKEFDIKYDPSNPVMTDPTLPKSVYEAAKNLLCDVGVLCLSGGRIIKISEEEVKDAIGKLPNRILLGEKKDSVELIFRDVKNERKPLVAGGPQMCPVSEKLYLDTLLSYAKEPQVDVLYTGILETFEGMSIRTGTPVEMAAAIAEASMAREAVRKTNRPGLCIDGVSHVTASATNFPDSIQALRPTDIHEITQLNELKMDWGTFNRMIHCQQVGCVTSAVQCPVLGGYAGGPEGTAIVCVAEALQGYLMTGGLFMHIGPSNVSFSTSTDRRTLWAGNMSLLAVKYEVKGLIGTFIWTAAGPCTEMQCCEIAAQSIANTACGADIVASAGGTKGMYVDYYTGMEGRIAGEVCSASAGLDLSDANEIVKNLLGIYEENLAGKKIPKGKSFQECYDLRTVTPSEEYETLWKKVKLKLEDLGLKFS